MSITIRQLFLHHVAQTSDSPLALEIESAEGIYLYGLNGERWVDMISGISVSNVGHRHPEVLAAVNRQLDKYMHLMVYGEYVITPQVELAGRLATIIPGLDSVYFVNSGTEAIEGAIKLSRRATGRRKIFSFRDAYHGSTTGALSLMSSPYFTDPFRPLLPEVYHLEPGSTDELARIDAGTAAVVFEPVRAEAGCIPVKHEFIRALRDRCSDMGALLIADEIQTGFGRTGPFFACEASGITPDILVMAKGMGGGMPIGAFMASRQLMQTLTVNPVLGHITTFGGHPVSCAAAAATFDIVRRIDTSTIIPTMEQTIRDILVHPAITGVSGKGLLLAVEFGTEEFARKVIGRCIETGVITDWFLFAAHKLRICPPLTINTHELESACRTILTAVDDVWSGTVNH